MNDLMSMGIHRIWKRFVIDLAAVRAGERVLDVAGGTGDLTRAFARQVGPKGLAVLSDINPEMLNEGRTRLLDEGRLEVPPVLANAECLPFADESFDIAFSSFGAVPFVAEPGRVMAEAARVLRSSARRANALHLEESETLNEVMIYGQLRSTIVDLLQVAGLSRTSAVAQMRDVPKKKDAPKPPE